MSEAVSSGSVVTQKELMEDYGAGNGRKGALPAAVVFCETADDVVGLTKWARENGRKILPVSSAPPHESAVVQKEGYVVCDLSRMKRIVRADRRNRVALAEVGVTFEELDGALERVGLRAMTPLAPRTGKSVVASYLDRTPTLVPRAQWDLSDPLLCTEVIMGSGKLFRTGCSSGPGTLEEQWATGQAQKNPMGPSAFDFFRIVQGSRGSMGIVTWASMKCELRPRVHELLMLPSDDLAPLIRIVYGIAHARWGEECLILDSNNLTRLTGVPGMPAFALLVGVAGFDYRPEQRVSYQKRGIEGIISSEGARVSRSIAGVGGRRMLQVITSPSDPYWKGSPAEHADVYFLTTMNRAPDFVSVIDETCKKEKFDRAQVGLYLQPQLGGRVTHFEATVFAPREEADRMTRALAEAAAAKGAYFSRPAGNWDDLAYRDKPLLVETFRRTKKIFDPDGVMNPDVLFCKEVV
ncbi:MAG: FAD-binding oxidoreductase [Actinobacteria bacterium]|nr:FAD-binding oxidoreductase [Actinomycetota bacterium]MBU2688470.1 FAD-binding oxidoreductase [Actinomycetota bacterium]